LLDSVITFSFNCLLFNFYLASISLISFYSNHQFSHLFHISSYLIDSSHSFHNLAALITILSLSEVNHLSYFVNLIFSSNLFINFHAESESNQVSFFINFIFLSFKAFDVIYDDLHLIISSLTPMFMIITFINPSLLYPHEQSITQSFYYNYLFLSQIHRSHLLSFYISLYDFIHVINVMLNLYKASIK